jgi:hypothetical protein
MYTTRRAAVQTSRLGDLIGRPAAFGNCPTSQRIQTALRTSGGRFFYEGEGIQGRDGAVEGAADAGGDELEADGAEEVAERLR